MKKQRRLMLIRVRTFGLVAVLGALVAGLLYIGIRTAAPVLFPREVATLNASADFGRTSLNLLDLPLRLLQFASMSLPLGHRVLVARAPSIALGVLSFFLYLYITRRWYGRRTMAIGGLLFVSSAWFLHVGSFAGLEVEYLVGILSLLAIHIGLYDHDDSSLMMYGWLLTNLLLLFIPGFAWLVLLSLVWQWRVLFTAWRKLAPLWNRISWSTLAVLGIAALALMLLHTSSLFWGWIGMPHHFVNWQATMRQVATAFSSLAYQGPRDPQLWLGRLPLLDAFMTAMFVMGVVFYVSHWRAARTRLLLGYLVLGSVLVGLQDSSRLSIMMPLVYLVAAGGIAYSLYLWLRRFPRNPVARVAGIAAVIILVGISCLYNLRQYYVAWPANLETRQLTNRQ